MTAIERDLGATFQYRLARELERLGLAWLGGDGKSGMFLLLGSFAKRIILASVSWDSLESRSRELGEARRWPRPLALSVHSVAGVPLEFSFWGFT